MMFEFSITGTVPPVSRLHVHVGESVHGFVHHGGQHVELGRAEHVGVEDSLHVSPSEGPPSEGHRGGGGGAELEAEGVQEGVDDRSFE